MMTEKWKSLGEWEHPAGTGNIVLSQAGIYFLLVGNEIFSCPQDWAAEIHRNEKVSLGKMIYCDKTREWLRETFVPRGQWEESWESN